MTISKLTIVLDGCPIKTKAMDSVTFQKLSNASSSNRWQQSSACDASRPPAKHVPPCRPTTLENAISLIAWSCLWKWILNMLVYISQAFSRAPQQVSPRSIQSALTLEGTCGIKEWFKGTAHWKQKCNFLLFTKFYLLSQAPLLVFLILVVILSFKSTANASTIFFRH